MSRDEKKTRERVVEKHLITSVFARGWDHRKMNRKTGDPDQLVLAKNGVAAFFETKRPVGGMLSEAQVIRHDELRFLGYDVFVCKNKREVDEALAILDVKVVAAAWNAGQ